MTQTPVSTLQPALTLTEFVDTTGVFPPEGGGSASGPFIGSIGIFAGESFIFEDASADGQTYAIDDNTALFSILGTDFGGNGTSNFELPNLGGIETIGAGQGAGLASVDLGQTLGQTSYDLTRAQLPSSLGGTSAAIAEQQPSLGLNYVINAYGVFPGDNLTLNSLGVVSAFAGNFAPGGELFCDGQLLPISQYTALFQLLGTTYGGNGTTTFALPDLQGRDIVGAGDGFTLGEQVGNASVNLTNANSPLGSDAPVDSQQPGLVMNYYIALQGIFPSEGETGNSSQSTPYLGQIVACAENIPDPEGWALCDGQLLSIAQNTALFALLGTTYGGDGVTTFALPNLEGRTVLGAGGSNGLGTLGQVSGANTITLTSANLPPLVAPTIALADDTGAPDAPGYTSDGRVNVGGIATGAVWRYSTDGGATFTTGSGTSFTLTGDGVKNVLVNQSWGSGDVSPNASLTFNLATSPPNSSNSDDNADILWRNTDGDVELWNSNSSSGGFTYDDLGVVNASWQIAGTGDFNGSGEAGILWRNTNGDTELWNPNGSGGFTYQDLGVVNTSWQIAGTGDFNGADEAGILWRNTNGGTELWNPTGSGGFTYQDLGVVSTSWQVAGTGDFTGNGEDSILWRSTNGDTELWNPNGSGGFTYQDLGVVNSSWQIAGTGDFSGDGQSGILWRNTDGDTELWNPNGSGGFTYDDLGVVNTGWQIVGTGDFTGNGQSGILWRDTNGDTELWNPNGSGGFTYQDLGVVSTSWSVHKTFA